MMYKKQFEINKNGIVANLQLILEKNEYYQSLLPNDWEYYASSYENFKEIPFLEKQDIQENSELFYTYKDKNPKELVIQHTSGSTGKPLKIIKSKNEEIHTTKNLYIRRMKWEIQIMKWKLLNLYQTEESLFQPTLLLGRDLSITSLEKQKVKIDNFKPFWLKGSPTSVHRLATFYNQSNETIDSLKLAEVTGEQLLPHQKKLIEDTFNCRVINMFASREFGHISYECPFGNLHADTTKMFFEIIDDKNQVITEEGKLGELVVTSLSEQNNAVMPLIRYRTGDLVEISELKEPCLCGDQTFCIKPIGGRITNLVYLENKVILSSIFDRMFSLFILRNENSIKEFQVIQEKINKFTVNLVVFNTFNHDLLSQITRTFFKYLGNVEIEYQFYPTLINKESGKTPMFISKMIDSEDIKRKNR